MITDIPTSEEFELNGLAFLNLAWESVLQPSLEASDVEEDEWMEEGEYDELMSAYWKRAQHKLSVSVALAQQGAEFLLKSKIASVSPFLLISSDVQRWPSGSDKENKSFADFQTVEAQSLIKLHDSVCGIRLPEAFRSHFEKLRRVRNAVMHSIDKQRSLNTKDVVLAILQTSNVLVGERSWPKIRNRYYVEQVSIWADRGASMNEMIGIATETMHVLNDLLTPAEALKYYGFSKKQRKYNCPGCSDGNVDFDAFLAQLRPNEPSSTNIYCVSCCNDYSVARKRCLNKKCNGNVIDPNWDDMCLTCGKSL